MFLEHYELINLNGMNRHRNIEFIGKDNNGIHLQNLTPAWSRYLCDVIYTVNMPTCFELPLTCTQGRMLLDI